MVEAPFRAARRIITRTESMDDKLKTPDEIDKWAAENANKDVHISHSIMKEIADTVSPEMCGYALVKIGENQGH